MGKNGIVSLQYFHKQFEKQIISASLSKSLSWFRFIDGVDMEWI